MARTLQLTRAIPATGGVRDPEIRRVLDAVIEALRNLAGKMPAPGSSAAAASIALLEGEGIQIDAMPDGRTFRIACTIDASSGGGGNADEPDPEPAVEPIVYGADMSVVLSESKVFSLVNDEAEPGASKYYGTDDTGAKGFHDLPEGGGGGADLPDGTAQYQVLSWTGSAWIADWVRAHG